MVVVNVGGLGREAAEIAMRETIEQTIQATTREIAEQVTKRTIQEVAERLTVQVSTEVTEATVKNGMTKAIQESVEASVGRAVGASSRELVGSFASRLNPSNLLKEGMENASKEALERGTKEITEEMINKGVREAVEKQLNVARQSFAEGIEGATKNSLKNVAGVADDVAESAGKVAKGVSESPAVQDDIVKQAQQAGEPPKVGDTPDIKNTRTLGEKVKGLLKNNWGKIALMGVAVAAAVITLRGGNPLKQALEAGGKAGEAIANTLAQVLWAVIGPVLNAVSGVWNWFKKWGMIIFAVIVGLIVFGVIIKLWMAWKSGGGGTQTVVVKQEPVVQAPPASVAQAPPPPPPAPVQAPPPA